MIEKKKKGPSAVVREIKRNTRRKFTSEEKRVSPRYANRAGINPNLY